MSHKSIKYANVSAIYAVSNTTVSKFIAMLSLLGGHNIVTSIVINICKAMGTYITNYNLHALCVCSVVTVLLI